MLDFLEPEGSIGRLWHRLIGRGASHPRHPDQEARLEAVSGTLAVFFRGLGGAHAVQLATSGECSFTHRLNLRQRLGVAEERLEHARRDVETVFLPVRIDLFPSHRLNRLLYFWLTAYSAQVPLEAFSDREECEKTDPLHRDLARLLVARETVGRVLAAYPGPADGYRALASAFCALLPIRKLPATERRVERIILDLLEDLEGKDLDRWIKTMPARRLAAPFNYRPALPVPLWVDVLERPTGSAYGEDEPPPLPMLAPNADPRKRLAHRCDLDQSQRQDPLILNRFEKILAIAEMVNVNRPSEDKEEENAQKAADDLEELTLARRSSGRPAARLKFDLDLPPEAVDPSALTGLMTYPEWDYTRQAYLSNHCRVYAVMADETGENWTPNPAAQRRIRRIRRQFEALGPGRERMRVQFDGEGIDMDALIRSMSESQAVGFSSDQVYTLCRPLR